MKKSNRTAPDRIILFEIGIILALLAVNYVFNMSYTSSFIIPPEEEDPFFDSVYVYNPPTEPLVNVEEQKVKQMEAVFFDPAAAITFVTHLFEIPSIPVSASMVNALPKPLPFLPTIPAVDTSFIMDNIADVMPQFPGGEEALGKFIRQNYTITDRMYAEASEVNLVLEFVVDRSGNITDIQVLRCSRPGLGAEQAALKLFKKMPVWTPGQHRGGAVNIRMKLPIKIQIL